MVGAMTRGVPDVHLYHSPGTRSDRVKLLLDMLDFPYSLTRIDHAGGEHKSTAYLEVNPFGRLPGMTIDKVPVVESAAQMLIIADLDPERRLAPAISDPARKHYVQWLVATPCSLEPMVTPAFSRLPKPGARKNVTKALAIQTSLFQGPYCAGEKLTAADILVHWGLRMLQRMRLLDGDALWTDYTDRLNGELDWGSLDEGD